MWRGHGSSRRCGRSHAGGRAPESSEFCWTNCKDSTGRCPSNSRRDSLMGEQERSSHPGSSDHLHEEVRTSLPEYAAALALGQAPRARYPVVSAHLESCSACRAELDALLELVMPAQSDRYKLAPS